MVSRFQHSLSDESVCAGTVLSSYKEHGLVPEAKVIEMFKGRGSHWRVEAEDISSGDNEGLIL
jgi:hypothetical protein